MYYNNNNKAPYTHKALFFNARVTMLSFVVTREVLRVSLPSFVRILCHCDVTMTHALEVRIRYLAKVRRLALYHIICAIRLLYGNLSTFHTISGICYRNKIQGIVFSIQFDIQGYRFL